MEMPTHHNTTQIQACTEKHIAHKRPHGKGSPTVVNGDDPLPTPKSGLFLSARRYIAIQHEAIHTLIKWKPLSGTLIPKKLSITYYKPIANSILTNRPIRLQRVIHNHAGAPHWTTYNVTNRPSR